MWMTGNVRWGTRGCQSQAAWPGSRPHLHLSLAPVLNAPWQCTQTVMWPNVAYTWPEHHDTALPKGDLELVRSHVCTWKETHAWVCWCRRPGAVSHWSMWRHLV